MDNLFLIASQAMKLCLRRDIENQISFHCKTFGRVTNKISISQHKDYVEIIKILINMIA